MKKFFVVLLAVLTFTQAGSQQTATPDVLWGDLFREVQLKRVFADNKTFVDCVPRYSPAIILKKFNEARSQPGFDLKDFVLTHFSLPLTPSVEVKERMALQQHLTGLWAALTRNADTLQCYSSLLPLPYSYVVPGGRFREIYYWDSYFTMQGLAVSGRFDLIEDMLKNFKWLIDEYQHIPNGNRNYYLSRSQPPYFAMMVELLQQSKGDQVFRDYFSVMEKEYSWWMQGTTNLKATGASRRVVRMPDGSVLNRYWDDRNAPRQESYAEDVATAAIYAHKDGKVYINLRAGAESGWDFSSRWFADTMHLRTIQTTDILPVDLNSLLYAYEKILAKAAIATRQSAKAVAYQRAAEKRKAALLRYCWNSSLGYFFDYDLKKKKTTNKWSMAGAMPLFVGAATKEQAAAARRKIEERFLKPGGVVTTVYHTGQQWDAPNGWAPLQFIAVKGLMTYGYNDLATEIATRWMKVNEKVFAATGKMMEKYNVENTALESGGGEYPTQDGFGWTNGVYLYLHQQFGKSAR